MEIKLNDTVPDIVYQGCVSALLSYEHVHLWDLWGVPVVSHIVSIHSMCGFSKLGRMCETVLKE